MTDIKSGNDTAKRNKIIVTALVVGLIFGIFLLAIYISDPNKGKPDAIEIARKNAEKTDKDFSINPSNSIDNENVWRNQSEDTLNKTTDDVQGLRTEIETLKQQLEEAKQERQYPQGSAEAVAPAQVKSQPPELPANYLNKTAGDSRTLPPPPSASTATGSNALAAQAEQLNRNDGLSGLDAANQAPAIKKASITKISVSGGGSGGVFTNDSAGGNGNDVANSQVPVLKNVSTYVPAGAFGKVVLLSGVDAPTGGLASSNPVPVLMRIKDKGTLANYFKSDLKECVVIGAAAGDISSERANIRLETITCILANGTVIEEPVKGYVAGEDGKAGFRGNLVSKQGSLIAKSALAGVASGLGTSITDQYQTISTSALGDVRRIDPNKAVQSGLATGFGNAMERIANFYIERANETYPIIEINAERVGDLVLTAGVDFKIKHIGLKRTN